MTSKAFPRLCVLTWLATVLACSSPPPPPPKAPEPPTKLVIEPDPPDVHIAGDHLEIDDHVNFGHDSAEILSSSDELLDHIALLLKNHKEIISLDVIGHTDSSGDDAHNLELSEQRARAVSEALVARGVPQEVVSHG